MLATMAESKGMLFAAIEEIPEGRRLLEDLQAADTLVFMEVFPFLLSIGGISHRMRGFRNQDLNRR